MGGGQAETSSVLRIDSTSDSPPSGQLNSVTSAATATLTLVNTVTNDNGGELFVSDFIPRIDGSPVTSGAANELMEPTRPRRTTLCPVTQPLSGAETAPLTARSSWPWET